MTWSRCRPAAYDNIAHFLDAIAKAYGRAGPAQKQAHAVMQRLENATTNEIFKIGLHEFITAFVQDNDRLGALISEQYLQY